MRTAYVKRIAVISGAFFSLAALVGPAFAADIRKPAPVIVAPKAPVFSWTGCYIGVNGGYGWGNKQFNPVEFLADPSMNIHGWLAGGQVGCDKQFASGYVFGVEGMGDWTHIKGSASVGPSETFSAHINWLASITARLGHANGQHLWYVKGGAAFARETDSFSEPACPEVRTLEIIVICEAVAAVPKTRTFTGKAIHAGWTIGVGGEWALHDHWSLGAEYNFYHFGTERVTLYPSGAGFGIPVDVRPTIHTITAQLNYRF